MSFRLKTLSVRNFMSVGNQTQSVSLDRSDLTLVLGENQDVDGADGGARNGTGKTTIINALSYALYGVALTNIKRDNLINKTNGKGMMVTVDFENNGVSYRIERGRKPNVLKFFVEDHEKVAADDAQGDSRETQHEIEDLLNMSHDMFKHIVALNTYTEPFLSMKSNDQRAVIEQLLGITQLSEKAEVLKEQIKVTRTLITEEEFNIKAINDANKRIQEQIENLVRRQKLWNRKQKEDVENIVTALEDLQKIDIDTEIQNHKIIAEYRTKREKIATEKKWLSGLTNDCKRYTSDLSRYEQELSQIEQHLCHACGQEVHDDKQEELKTAKEKLLEDAKKNLILAEGKQKVHEDALAELGEVPADPKIFYNNLDDALEHRNTISNLTEQLERLKDQEDPYVDQIDDMQNKGIQTVDYTNINEYTRMRDHQEFLFKLLTNKDSFIRKKIIDQNLSFLNGRLKHYLTQLGLPHTVEFQNDLTVEIQQLGRDLDFDNLSRGERNRLILSLSWAFRDVWENLYHPINLLFVDELMDSGMDTAGVEHALEVLKKTARERKKSVWLISHKDELQSRVHNILTVIKSGGFTEYSTDIEVV